MSEIDDRSATDQERFGTPRIGEPAVVGAESPQQMGVPTVYLVGEDRLALIPEYLNLGTVVVVAPDRETLSTWRSEQEPAATEEQTDSAVLDMSGRRIMCHGSSLPLSELEFKVLGAMLETPGRAMSFQELRRLGWGDGPEMPVDPYTVKALIQRLRAKLSASDATLRIESVRGYGFRVEGETGEKDVPSVGAARP